MESPERVLLREILNQVLGTRNSMSDDELASRIRALGITTEPVFETVSGSCLSANHLVLCTDQHWHTVKEIRDAHGTLQPADIKYKLIPEA